MQLPVGPLPGLPHKLLPCTIIHTPTQNQGPRCKSAHMVACQHMTPVWSRSQQQAHVLGTGEKSPPKSVSECCAKRVGLPPDHPNTRHFPGMLGQSWDSCPFDSCLQNTLWASVKLHATKICGSRQPPPVAHRQVMQGDTPLESECFA